MTTVPVKALLDAFVPTKPAAPRADRAPKSQDPQADFAGHLAASREKQADPTDEPQAKPDASRDAPADARPTAENRTTDVKPARKDEPTSVPTEFDASCETLTDLRPPGAAEPATPRDRAAQPDQPAPTLTADTAAPAATFIQPQIVKQPDCETAPNDPQPRPEGSDSVEPRQARANAGIVEARPATADASPRPAVNNAASKAEPANATSKPAPASAAQSSAPSEVDAKPAASDATARPAKPASPVQPTAEKRPAVDAAPQGPKASDTRTVANPPAEVDAEAAAPPIEIPGRPLTIREFNDLLARIDPQWASKGLTLPSMLGGMTTAAARAERLDVSPEPAPDSFLQYSIPFHQSAPDAPLPFQASTPGASTPQTHNADAPVNTEAARDAQPLRDHVTSSATTSPSATVATSAQAEKLAVPAVPAPAPMPLTADRAAAPTSAATNVGVRAISGIGTDRAVAKSAPGAAEVTSGAAQPPNAMIAQVQRGLAAAIAQGGGQVTLRLAPEALGRLRVKLDLRADTVKLRFEVGSAAARSLLDDHLPGLSRMLEDQGLRVAHASVGTDPSLATRDKEPAQAPAQHGASFPQDAGSQTQDHGAKDGAGDRQASEHALPQQMSAKADDTPRSGEIFIEREGGVLDPVTLRLNAVA